MITDQLKIEATNNARTTARPATVDSWNANMRPSDARIGGKNKAGIFPAPHSRSRRATCKILAGGLALAVVAAASARAAQDGPYDVFSKALAPFASSIFGASNGQPGAMVAECLVTDATGPLAAAKGTRFRLAVQAPDRLRVDVVRDGGKLTACRDGKELWAVPAAPMRMLAQAADFDLDKTAPDKTSTPLIPIALDAQMLAFLPVVFDVKDKGTNGNPPSRVLEFGLLRELREAAKAPEFTMRAWIGDDCKPSRLVLTTPDYSLDLAVEKLGFAAQLDPAAWQPAEGEDALRLPASTLNDLFKNMLGTKLQGN